MGDVQKKINEWITRNRQNMIRCPHQPGNLLITKQSCQRRRIKARQEDLANVMKGDVIASERVELAAQARVHGNVHYKVLEMAAGAQITGRVVREDEPRKQLPKPEPKPEAAANEGESAIEVRVEPKEKSKVDAKRS